MHDGKPMPAAPAPRLVIKLGGSVVSDREGVCALRHDAIQASVKALGALIQGGRDCPIMVLGGGAFAHPFARVIKSDTSVQRSNRYANRMDRALEDLRVAYQATCLDHGIPVVTYREHDLFEVNDTGSRARRVLGPKLADRQVVPILTGGCFRLGGGRFHLLSSDDLPLLIHSVLPVSRCLLLTDVRGVLPSMDTEPDHPPIACITPGTADLALKAAGRANKQGDMTGGMLRKVTNCIALMEKGVPSYVGDGRALSETAFDDICAGKRSGTYFHPDTSFAGETNQRISV